VKIAVVGAGITGLGAAWLISRQHEVTLFEAAPRLGGHSNTVEAAIGGTSVPVDTGFIVYNTACYPNLIALFDQLAVPTAMTSMSFAVSLNGGRYEYNGNGLGGLIGHVSNAFRPSHWMLASDILRFFREAKQFDHENGALSLTLGDWLKQRGYSRAFIERHIIPMGAAIWSTPAAEMLKFPAVAFIRFFANHGLLQVNDRPEWRTVRGGSREYVQRILATLNPQRVIASDPVVSVSRRGEGVEIKTAGGRQQQFDRCLVATHADTALGLLADPAPDEQSVLGAFRYATNEAVLHTDLRLMPRRRKLWSSWNYLGDARHSDRLSVSYWMNRLQPLGNVPDVFVTLNPYRPIEDSKILQSFTYEHPMFDTAAILAQREIWRLQGRNKTWFAGSYCGYGFHEDGLQAGLAAAEDMSGVLRPWSVPDGSSRITLSPQADPLLRRCAGCA
jgi:uncharacterized protein